MSLRIGTSGWSYPTGKGTWNGVFYPATRSKRDGTKDFDELRFYAEHFDTVEVNTTFYGHATRRGGAAMGVAHARRASSSRSSCTRSSRTRRCSGRRR